MLSARLRPSCLGGRPCRTLPASKLPLVLPARLRPIRANQLMGTELEEETISTQDRSKLDNMLDRFNSFDLDGNGMIDREELRMLLESVDAGTTVLLSQHWLPDAELDRVMEAYDKDSNGVIDFEEFQNIVYDGLLLDGMLSEYEEAFNAVDKSGNGTIGAMELQELFQKIGQPMTFEKLSDMMLQYDRDESGQIEFGEFLMMCRDHLLDLKEIQNYMSSAPSQEKSQHVLDASEGEMSIIFSKQELDEVLSQKDKLSVVFSAMTWCRPCKAMQRPAQKLAQHYKQTYNFVKLFGNSNQQTKQLFKQTLKIRSTPCFMIFKGEELLYTQTGKNQVKLEDALRSFAPSEKVPEERVYEE